MITENEIKKLADADFDTFKKTVEALDKPDLVAVRRYLQPMFNERMAKEGEVWLVYVDEVKEKEGRYPTVEEKEGFFRDKGYASHELYKKIEYTKRLISKRSQSWLKALKKKIESEHRGEEGLFFGVDVETGGIFGGSSREEVLEKAKEERPDTYLYMVVIGEKYKMALK